MTITTISFIVEKAFLQSAKKYIILATNDYNGMLPLTI